MFSGYSGTTPSLWAMMGYDAMVIRFEVRNGVHRKQILSKIYEAESKVTRYFLGP